MSIFSDTNLKIIDLPKRYFKANELYVDSCLLLDTETKEFILAQNNANGYEEIFRVGGLPLPLQVKYANNDGITDSLILAYSINGEKNIIDNTTITSIAPLQIDGAIVDYVETISLSKVKTMGLTGFFGITQSTGIFLFNLTKLTSAEFQSLEQVPGMITLKMCPLLNTIDLSNLMIAGGMELSDLPITSINLSKLKRLGNISTTIYNNASLTSLSFPDLEYIYNLGIYNNSALESIDFSNVSMVHRGMNVYDNPSLTQITLNPNGIDLVMYSNGYNFQNNALTQSCVDSILSIIRNYSQANNINGGNLLLNFGLNSPPTGGAGNPDYVYLTGTLGWNVQIN